MKLYTVLALCCLSLVTMAQGKVQPDSLAVSTDSVRIPLNVRDAKAELKQARLDVKEAKQELKEAKAEKRHQRQVMEYRNEIRLGWGDQIFETLMWHNPTSYTLTMPTGYRRTYKENYRYHQHLWLEYQHHFNHWFALGAMVDMSEVAWDNVERNGQGIEQNRTKNQYFYNAVIMPTIRFTYYRHPNVNLYSGLGVGMDINGGTETNAKGHHTDIGAAVNITVFGVSAHYKRFFAAVDFGGMYALKNANCIFLASSRILNASIGVKF